LLRGKKFQRTLIMHPLPRVDELAFDMDEDPRSMYFKQASQGVPVRMALICLLLGVKEVTVSEESESMLQRKSYPVYERDSGLRCPNATCVSNQETEKRYIKPKFRVVRLKPLTLRCVYCDHELQPRFVASSDWHEGKLESKKYHSADSRWTRDIRPEKLIVFDSEERAKAEGFRPSSYVR
ncbi:MAG: hypothetical protein KAW95_02995, partial [Dehalococcoidia bacterium]|nr:hypothetical protein [Dehalococcoidia bacterium]